MVMVPRPLRPEVGISRSVKYLGKTVRPYYCFWLYASHDTELHVDPEHAILDCVLARVVGLVLRLGGDSRGRLDNPEPDIHPRARTRNPGTRNPGVNLVPVEFLSPGAAGGLDSFKQA